MNKKKKKIIIDQLHSMQGPELTQHLVSQTLKHGTLSADSVEPDKMPQIFVLHQSALTVIKKLYRPFLTLGTKYKESFNSQPGFKPKTINKQKRVTPLSVT